MRGDPQATQELREYLALARQHPKTMIPAGPIERYLPPYDWPPQFTGAMWELGRQGKTPRQLTIIERFLLYLDRGDPDECWPWTGCMDGRGYGRFGTAVSNRSHQFAVELWVGPIPEGTELDHVCHDPKVCHLGRWCPHRACANPRHLAAVPPAVNRGRISKIRLAQRRPFCKRGHHRDSEHWSVRGDGRPYCLTCAKIRNQARAAS